MKKIILTLLVAALTTAIITSCTKERKPLKNETTVEMQVDAGIMGYLNLEPYKGSNRIATITRQATNFAFSSLAMENDGKLYYKYLRNGTPKAGGNGTDVVVIDFFKASSGSNNNNGIMAGGCVIGGDPKLHTKLVVNIKVN